MAYTCNLLLRTLPAIGKQKDPDRKDQTIILDIDSAIARRALKAKRRQAAQPTQ